MYDKPTRKVDKDLMKQFRYRNCVACGTTPCEGDHIFSRGAGGPDEEFNLWPVCRHHHSERHSLGIKTFIQKYPITKLILKIKGWEIEPDLSHPRLKR